jgi:DNA-binding LacI/PurR family transcriptional regulator
MNETSKITIKEVAKHAGVGIGTVSRAINGATGISTRTRNKVLESIQQLGYTPDRIAQSMRSQKFKNIAFFIDISNVAFAQIAKGIHYELEHLGYTLSLCDIGNNNVIDKVNSFLEGRRFDGIILSVPRENDQELQELFSLIKIPIVTLDRDVPGLPAGIITDYKSSVKKATQYLLSLGHRGIALVGGSSNIRPTRVSIAGFREAYDEYGISCPPDLIIGGEFTSEFGRRVMFELLQKIHLKEVTAIFSLNNQIFSGILQVMRENGLDYPGNVSLVTIEDSELTQLLKPAVTVIRRPLVEMGKSVARVLTRYIEDPNLYGKQSPMVIPTEFIVRDSCKDIRSFK